MVTVGGHRAIFTEFLPKRRPQEVWQDGALLSPAAASQVFPGHIVSRELGVLFRKNQKKV